VEGTGSQPYGIAVVIAVLALSAIVWAVNKSKTESPELVQMEKEFETV
jgi:hypothetical protein